MQTPGETLVGRGPELARIDAALAALEQGGPACLAVEGEPGIGKSRLVAELRERAGASGHIVLHGQAAEFERDRPFGVLIEALDPYLRSSSTTASAPRRIAARRPGRDLPRDGAGGRRGRGDRRRALPRHRAVRVLLEQLAARSRW